MPQFVVLEDIGNDVSNSEDVIHYLKMLLITLTAFPGIAGLIPVPWIGSAVDDRPSSTVAMVHDQGPLYPNPPVLAP